MTKIISVLSSDDQRNNWRLQAMTKNNSYHVTHDHTQKINNGEII